VEFRLHSRLVDKLTVLGLKMTTVREICETGFVPKQVVEYFVRNRGQTPLCCFEAKKLGSQIVVTCGWLKEWLAPEDFRTRCLRCQGEISEKLGVG